jgi:uncharacterized RDD family membrane protein YckC
VGDAFLIPALLTGISVWLIWSFVVYGESCSPGKKFVGLRVADIRTGAPLSRGMMALREIVIKGMLFSGIASALTLGIFPIIADLWLLWDKDNQQLWDKIINTLVVYDPQDRLLAPR